MSNSYCYTWGMTYKKGRGHYEPLVSNDDKASNKKLAMALRMKEREEQERWKLEHAHGYCKKCGMLIPMTGHCDCED